MGWVLTLPSPNTVHKLCYYGVNRIKKLLQLAPFLVEYNHNKKGNMKYEKGKFYHFDGSTFEYVGEGNIFGHAASNFRNFEDREFHFLHNQLASADVREATEAERKALLDIRHGFDLSKAAFVDRNGSN